jgi:hypothetical protein
LTGIAYLRASASRAGRLGKKCRPRATARRGVSPNMLTLLNFIFGADSMAETPWQERRQPEPAGERRRRGTARQTRRAAVLAYRASAKSAAPSAGCSGASGDTFIVSVT